MARKQFPTEQIILKLREAEVDLAQGNIVGQVCRENVRSKKRVERLWRREGLQVPRRQLQLARLWLTGGSRIRWLTIVEEYTRKCWASALKSLRHVIDPHAAPIAHDDLFVRRVDVKHPGTIISELV